MKYIVAFTPYAPGNEPVYRKLFIDEIQRFNDPEGLKKYVSDFCLKWNRPPLDCDSDIEISFADGDVDERLSYLDISEHFGIKEGGFVYGLGAFFEKILFEENTSLTVVLHNN